MLRARLTAAVLRRLLLLVLTVLVAGLFSSALVRLAPGLGMDERLLDSRLSSDSLAALDSGVRAGGVLADFRRYLKDLARGDWGESLSLHRPVRELVRERLRQEHNRTGDPAAGAPSWRPDARRDSFRRPRSSENG